MVNIGIANVNELADTPRPPMISAIGIIMFQTVHLKEADSKHISSGRFALSRSPMDLIQRNPEHLLRDHRRVFNRPGESLRQAPEREPGDILAALIARLFSSRNPCGPLFHSETPKGHNLALSSGPLKLLCQ